MTVLQFLISAQYGCCTTAELMALNKQDRESYDTLRKWAVEEMNARGITIVVSK